MDLGYMAALKPDYDNFIQVPQMRESLPDVSQHALFVNSDTLEKYGQQVGREVTDEQVQYQSDFKESAAPLSDQFKANELSSDVSLLEPGLGNTNVDVYNIQTISERNAGVLSQYLDATDNLQRYNEDRYPEPIEALCEKKASYCHSSSTSANNDSGILLVPPSAQAENSVEVSGIRTNKIVPQELQPNSFVIPYGQPVEIEEPQIAVSVTVKESQPYPSPVFQVNSVRPDASQNLFGSNYGDQDYYGNHAQSAPPPYHKVVTNHEFVQNFNGIPGNLGPGLVSQSSYNMSFQSTKGYHMEVPSVAGSSKGLHSQTERNSEDPLTLFDYDVETAEDCEEMSTMQISGESRNARNCAKSRLKKKALCEVETSKADIFRECLQFVTTSPEISMSDNARRTVDWYLNKANNLKWEIIFNRLLKEKEQKEMTKGVKKKQKNTKNRPTQPNKL